MIFIYLIYLTIIKKSAKLKWEYSINQKQKIKKQKKSTKNSRLKIIQCKIMQKNIFMRLQGFDRDKIFELIYLFVLAKTRRRWLIDGTRNGQEVSAQNSPQGMPIL